MKPIEPEGATLSIGFRYGSGVLLLAAFLAGCRSTPPAQDPRNDLQARLAGAQALSLYAQSILAGTTNAAATHAAMEAGITALRQAGVLDPDNPRLLAALLDLLASQKRYHEALHVAERFLARTPDNPGIRLDAARLAESANLPLTAARHCEHLLASTPDNRELTEALPQLYFRAGHDQRALNALRAAHLRFNDARSAMLTVHWAIHFTRDAGEPTRALPCLNLALSQVTSAATRSAMKTLVAENQLRLCQTNAALESLLGAHREDPGATLPILRIGAILADRWDGTAPLPVSAAHCPDATTTLLIRAATLQARGNPAAAVETLRDAYARRMKAGYFPDRRFYLWLASLLEEGEHIEEAETVLHEALAAYPVSHEIQNFLAYMWAEQNKRLDKADRLVTEALRAQPENAAYLDTKGWILFKKQRPYDALQFLLKAADLEPNEPEILDHTGDVLLAVGRISEAIAFWQRSQKIAPTPERAENLRRQQPVAPTPPAAP